MCVCRWRECEEERSDQEAGKKQSQTNNSSPFKVFIKYKNI